MRQISWLALAALLAAACGSVSNPSADGGPIGDDDGGGEPDAGPGPVSVVVLSEDGRRQPVRGAQVAFFQPDGSLAQLMETGEDGRATAELAPGGAVLVHHLDPVEGAGGIPHVMGVLDVHPGDEITLGGSAHSNTPTQTMQLQTMQVDGANSYSAETPCGYFSGQINPAGGNVVNYRLDFYDTCDDSPFPLVAIARSPDGSAQVLLEPEVEIADGTTFTPGARWEPMGMTALTIEGVPDDLSFINAGFTFGSEAGSVLTTSLAYLGQDATGSSVSFELEHVPQLDSAVLQLSLQHEQQRLGPQLLHIWIDDPTSVELSLGELLLPWLGTPLVDLRNNTITIPQVGEGEWDTGYVQLSWSRQEGQQSLQGSWTLLIPPGVTTATLPALPAEISDWLPPEVDALFAFGRILERSDLDGWDAARQLGFAPFYDLGPPGSTMRMAHTAGGS